MAGKENAWALSLWPESLVEGGTCKTVSQIEGGEGGLFE